MSATLFLFYSFFWPNAFVSFFYPLLFRNLDNSATTGRLFFPFLFLFNFILFALVVLGFLDLESMEDSGYWALFACAVDPEMRLDWHRGEARGNVRTYLIVLLCNFRSDGLA